MGDTKIDNLFIVGAGFSYYAGLPLSTTFTKALLDVRGLKLDGPSTFQVELLKKFVSDTFDHGPGAAAKYWPQLEDIFTCIDLSANTGHHLGPHYSPSQLRTIRRALIVRIIRMLHSAYNKARNGTDDNWTVLEQFFRLVNPTNSAFLSMNWDTVIEAGLKKAQSISDYDYGCNAIRAEFSLIGDGISLKESEPEIQLLKPHGSSNWLYCDACRQVFWFPASSTDKIATQLFRRSDWDVVEKIIHKSCDPAATSRKCPGCSAKALGTRFATFSYRKALDFPMHESSWRTAERLLREAKNWIFVGYSLPAADYEFKLLLKRVELSRQISPNMVLITGGDNDAVDQTQLAYQRFFGPNLGSKEPNVYTGGIDSKAINGLQELGALKAKKPLRPVIKKKLRSFGK